MIETLVIPALTLLLLLPIVGSVARFRNWPHCYEGRAILSVMLVSGMCIRWIVWTVCAWVFPAQLQVQVSLEKAIPSSVLEVAVFLILVGVAFMWNTRIGWQIAQRETQEKAIMTDQKGKG